MTGTPDDRLMLTVIRAVVRRDGDPSTILLQRRDEPGEPVRGAIEIPGGRWRAGEHPFDALTREVAEETGVEIRRIGGIATERFSEGRAIAAVSPLVVAAGTEAAFPAVHVVLVADGTGEPRPAPGETADVRWWGIDEVADLLERDAEVIPSTVVALRAYLASLASSDPGSRVPGSSDV